MYDVSNKILNDKQCAISQRHKNEPLNQFIVIDRVVEMCFVEAGISNQN